MRKFIFRSGVFLLVAALLLNLPCVASATEMAGTKDEYTPIEESITTAATVVTSHTDLISAIAGAVGPTVIELGSDINTTSTITIPIGADIALTGNHSLTANANFPVVTVNGTFTLDGPTLTRTGTIGNNSQGVNVRDTGNFTMRDGLIHGHRGTGGGGVSVPIINFGWDEYWNPIERSGIFTMYGGIIRDNTATGGGGGGVFSGGIFTMHGGVIKDNAETSSFGLGGGVNVNDGSFVMYGGEISGNSTVGNNGGGLHVHMSATFVMNGGDIIGNHSANGGGGVNANGAFTMNAGKIADNTASTDGGGVFHRGPVTVNGGEISGNAATRNGGGAFIDGAMVMQDGEIRGNTANGNAVANGGGGVFVSNWGNFTMHGGQIADNNAAADGGGVFFPVARRIALVIDPNASFNGNTAGNGTLDYGLGAGLRDFPNIQWSGANSVPDSHLLNNYDINNATVGEPGPLTVVFDLNGGLVDGSPDNISLPIIQGERIGISNVPAPSRENYNLSGWQLDGTGEAVSADEVAALVVNRPLKLVAVWTPVIRHHTVVFDLNGGLVDGSPDNISLPIIQGERIGISNVPTPTRENHNHSGWQIDGTDETLSAQQVAELVVDRQLTLVAVLTPVVEYHGMRQAYLIGTPEGLIRPLGNITRAEVATIFFRLISDADREQYWQQSNPFPDITLNNWFNNAVSTTTNMGLLRGLRNGTFAPNRPITRAELAAVMARFMNVIGAEPTVDAFDDIGGHWARNYINQVAASSWGQRQNKQSSAFYPDQPITRAEVAEMINHIFERLPETSHDLLPDMRKWQDNANVGEWYYLYIQSASNSYTYRIKPDGIHETWLAIIPPRNWAALERPDSTPSRIFAEA